jgi:hypothetical protein
MNFPELKNIHFEVEQDGMIKGVKLVINIHVKEMANRNDDSNGGQNF